MRQLGLFRSFMMRTLPIIPIGLLLLLPVACTKDKQDISVQPVVESARALHHTSKLWEMMYLTISGQATAILPEGMRIIWVDSTNADWDGLEFYLDFGKRSKVRPKGILCRDGYYRSGIYRVSLSGDVWTPGLYLALTMNAKDSCTFSNGSNLFQYEGRMHIQVKQALMSTIQSAFSTASEASKTWFESDAEVQMVSGNGSTLTLSGSGSVRSEVWQMLWDTKALSKTMQGQGSFSKGELNVWNSKQQYRVDFDPFGNEADDLWMKVWKGRSEFLFDLD
jgi:hypothetical protein